MSTESQFDPDAFLNETISGENSTENIPVPVGEYQAVITKVGGKQGVSDRTGQPWRRAEITFEISDPAVAEITGRPSSNVTYSMMLDLNAQGQIDMGRGRNVRLGRLRQAFNLNTGAFSWNQLVGRVARIQVEHDEYNGQLYARVKNVAGA